MSSGMEPLGVSCKTCGKDFATGLVLGASGLPRVGDLERRCPACRALAVYESADLHPLRRPATG